MALEVQGEGLEDERRGVARVERDAAVGLGDGRLVEPSRGLWRGDACTGEELVSLREVPARARRGREWRATGMPAARMKKRHYGGRPSGGDQRQD